MPKKRNPDLKHGEKVLKLFIKLLFANRPLSLQELEEAIGCSKQNVSLLIKILEASHELELERTLRDRKAYYAIVRPAKLPQAAYLSGLDLDALRMCRAFVEGLMGQDNLERVERAYNVAERSLSDGGQTTADPSAFARLTPGAVDYTAHQDKIHTLIQAIKARRVCKTLYWSAGLDITIVHYLKPLKLFCHRDTLYLYAWKAKNPKDKTRFKDGPCFPLPIHRFQSIEIAAHRSKPFDPPKDDFETYFREKFGIMKGWTPQKVDAEFTDWAAVYVSERTWSPDQKITKLLNRGIRIEFTAASFHEVLNWLLSFGSCAKVNGPPELVEKVVSEAQKMAAAYPTQPPSAPDTNAQPKK